MVGRWNYETHEYDNYEPAFPIKLYTEDMEEIVHCTNCGVLLPFGRCFTSRELHTPVGMGYPVCEVCYEQETERDRKYRERP